jgi:GT2 family glycosyltransferase
MAGYRCIYVPKAIVRHKISETIGVASDFQIYQSRRNVEYVYFKNMPLGLILLTFPIHVVYDLLALAQAVGQGRLSVFLKAKWDFVMNFKKTCKKRRAVQWQRKISLNELLSSFSKDYLLMRCKSFLSRNRLGSFTLDAIN